MRSIIPYTEEHEMYRKAIASFMEKEITPNYAKWDEEGVFPKEIFKKMGDNGYLCTWADEKYGGVSGDFWYDYILNEEMMSAGANCLPLPLHSSVATPYIDAFGSDAQKERWLPQLVSGDITIALAMTEPGAGSDLMAMRGRAVKDGDSYILNGSKTFITNAVHADITIVAMKTNPELAYKGISLFIVEKDTPGFSTGKPIPKIGLHAGGTSELFFEDCRVPAENLIGKEGAGFLYLMQKLQQERVLIAAGNVYMAQKSLDLAMEYVEQRQLFGKKLSQFQNTQFVLAEIATEIALGRAFIEQVALGHSQGNNVVKEVSMAKYWLSEMNHRAASRCLQLFGGYGYCTEYEISRQFVDSRVQSIFGGASEIMKVVIAKEIGL